MFAKTAAFKAVRERYKKQKKRRKELNHVNKKSHQNLLKESVLYAISTR